MDKLVTAGWAAVGGPDARKNALRAAVAAGTVTLAGAQAQGSAPQVDSGDTAWILASSALVLLMTPALAFFYGGLVRGRNALNTMMMSFIAMGVVSVLWLLAGYSLAFAPGGPLIGGLEWLGLTGVGQEPSSTYMPTVPHLAFMVFQAMFAIITPALISGAVVERLKFKTYLVFIGAWSLLVYAPLAHWVWSPDGWLFKLGALDFAGGTVVHVSAGVSALVAALLTGPRRGFPRNAFVPHNVPFALLGAGLLWFGWFGFNAGSAGGANGLAANAFVTTSMAAAAAMTAWAIIDIFRVGKTTAVGAATGLVVGLVAVTPAAGFVTPLASLAIGAIAAGISYAAIQIRARLSFDDSLDVFSCHGLGGITGAILTGVFATKAVNPAGSGLVDGNGGQVLTQALGVLAAAGLAAAGTVVILTVLRYAMGLRPAAQDEETGLDIADHGEAAYHGGEYGLGGSSVSLGSSVTLTPAGSGLRANAAD